LFYFRITNWLGRPRNTEIWIEKVIVPNCRPKNVNIKTLLKTPSTNKHLHSKHSSAVEELFNLYQIRFTITSYMIVPSHILLVSYDQCIVLFQYFGIASFFLIGAIHALIWIGDVQEEILFVMLLIERAHCCRGRRNNVVNKKRRERPPVWDWSSFW